MTRQRMIDVSFYQGRIDWKRVKEAGIHGAIIRAGFGAGNIDSEFHRNMAEAIKQALLVGAYWFSYAYTTDMAVREADYCYEEVKKYNLRLPVFFDWESASYSYARDNGVTVDKALYNAMTKAFCRRIKERGYEAGFYYNEDYKDRFVNFSELDEFARWYARYISEKPTDCDLWQYSADGTIPGIPGDDVDLDYLINTDILKDSDKCREED